MKIEIDFETSDAIVQAEMFDQYSTLKQEIKEQKTIEKPLDYQKEDLKYTTVWYFKNYFYNLITLCYMVGKCCKIIENRSPLMLLLSGSM